MVRCCRRTRGSPTGSSRTPKPPRSSDCTTPGSRRQPTRAPAAPRGCDQGEAVASAVVPTAFVTGGSGFVGGALIRRLVSDGWTVRALARSDRSVESVERAGAEGVRGDLDDANAMRAGADGADVFHHAAAKVEDFGDPADFRRVTVQGTKNALEAAREAGVPRFVHVGTEAALMAGQPLVNVD